MKLTIVLAVVLAVWVFEFPACGAQFQAYTCPCTGMTCHSCKNVSSPKYCQDTTLCGQGEICSTREFSDHTGFQLGCEENRVSKEIWVARMAAGCFQYNLEINVLETCELLRESHTPFGKRDSPDEDPAPSDRCYECCRTDECNKQLCQQQTGEHGTTTSPPTQSCPVNFVPFKNNCYLFQNEEKTYFLANKYCKEHGATLLSINSKDENNFLAKELILRNGTSGVHGFWTCGVYNYTKGGYEWTDGSPFNYTNWTPYNPPTPPSTAYASEAFHIIMGNPAEYATAPTWVYITFYSHLSFICKIVH